MTSRSTQTTTPAKAPAKKPAAKKAPTKKAGSSRVAALASKLATSPGSVKATASLPDGSGDAAAATASLLGLSPAVITAPVPSAPSQEADPTSLDRTAATPVVERAEADMAPTTASTTSDDTSEVALPSAPTTAEPLGGELAGEASALRPQPVDRVVADEPAEATRPHGTGSAPDPIEDTAAPDPAGHAEPADATEPTEPDAATEPTEPDAATEATEATDAGTPSPSSAERVQPVESAAPSRRPAPKKTAAAATKKARATKPASSGVEDEQAERLDDLVWTLSSPEHSLDQQHDRISKLTLELPIPLVDVLNRWELDQVRRTGRRLYRERLIDLALAELPTDMDKVVAMARDLPAWLKYAETEQVGSRVRAPVALELKVMKQELKLRREKGTYVRHIYAVALLDFLTSYGVPVEEPTR